MTVASVVPNERSASPTLDILVVEDERDIRESLESILAQQGHRITTAADGHAALKQIDERVFDLAICDVRLPKVGGMELLRCIRQQSPSSQVIMMSAYGDVAQAVEAIQAQAAHYLAKPFPLEQLLELVDRAAEQRAVQRKLANPATPRELMGDDPAIERVRRMIDSIAESDAAVLVSGESGTGKELVARAIHEASPRADGPFMAVNCSAFPDTLLEAELFGHERGAFTGAHQRRTGRFAAADGGSLFLDEVAEMALPAQAKLLRVLEDHRYQRLGSNDSHEADVRIISATNIDVKEAIATGRFREDIYHRLKVFHLQLPPLRERRGDLNLLIHHFYRQLCGAEAGPPQITPAAWAAIEQYRFPGNVRELKHLVEHAVVLSDGSAIDLEHLPDEVRGRPVALRPRRSFLPLPDAMGQFEREYLLRALRRCEWQKAKTAELLGISRKTLWQKLKSHGIEGSDGD